MSAKKKSPGRPRKEAKATEDKSAQANEAPIDEVVEVEEVQENVEQNNPQSTPTEQAPYAAEENNADFLKNMGLGNETAPATEVDDFAGNVTPRGPHAEIKTDASVQEVPEYQPPFTPPPIDDAAQQAQQQASFIPPNPALNNLTDAEKRQGAERLVDSVFEIWGWAKSMAGSYSGIDIKKVKKLHADLKIDMNAVIVIPGTGERVTFLQIIENFNSQTGQAFIVNDAFKARVREPMIREFIKRNIGLTDIQQIAVFWGLELAQTGAAFFQLKNMGNEIIANQMELFKGTSRPSAAATPPSAQPAAKAEEAKPEYKEPEEKKL